MIYSFKSTVVPGPIFMMMVMACFDNHQWLVTEIDRC
jgi:hypothetical protein